MELGKLTIKVDQPDGVVEVDIDLDPNALTLRESVRLEKELGETAATALFSGGEVAMSPRIIQVIIWAKLVTQFPTLALDEFDLDLGVVAAELGDDTEREPLVADDVEKALFVTDEPLRSVGETGNVSETG